MDKFIEKQINWVITELDLLGDSLGLGDEEVMKDVVRVLKSELNFASKEGTPFSQADVENALVARTVPPIEREKAITISTRVKNFLARFDFLDGAKDLYKNARLPRDLFDDPDNRLEDYAQAAISGKDTARPFLDLLTGLQEPDGNRANVFAAILASSGTGKTQLAATASLTYDKATTIYLLCSEGNQRFYEPHANKVVLFQKTITDFIDQVGAIPSPSATAIKQWAQSVGRDHGTSSFVNMLYRILVDDETEQTRVKLTTLKEEIQVSGKKFLVFLDEVPAKGEAGFHETVCLRDTLRYLGISPVLMSTHTGSQDYLMKGSRGSSSVWMHIISRLPSFTPFPMPRPISSFLPSERPLVLGTAMGMSQATLPEVVQQVRKRLQESKLHAWTFNPALQLVQLFCTDITVLKNGFEIAHNLVGHHFGSLSQKTEERPNKRNCGATSYSCVQLSQFQETLAVAPVCAEYEPILYLALATWDETMFGAGASTLFPLVDSNHTPLTVRGAFEKCKHIFKPTVSTENASALKADGNLLEVLVLASLTLASLKTGKSTTNSTEYLPGMALDKYLPLVNKLMSDSPLHELPQRPAFFDNIAFDWPLVPALGGANSHLPKEIAHDTGSCLGYLRRPEDRAMVDGEISYMVVDDDGKATGKMAEKPFISIECKNWTGGVDIQEMKGVFKKIKPNIKCSLVFVSSLKKGMFSNTKLDALKKECFAEHKNTSICVMLWQQGAPEPSFLRVGKSTFAPQSNRVKTELLVVIFEVGLISQHSKWCVPQRKRKFPCCANVPLDSQEESSQEENSQEL